jgi:hypothetical protein
MKKILSFFISLIAIMALNDCGGGNDEIHNWIIPENISGIWVVNFSEGDMNLSKLKEYRFTLQELNGSISGNFEEFYYDDKYFNYPIEGSFNWDNGVLKLRHDSHLYGYQGEIFRFTSEAMMYAVSKENRDLPRYECIKIADM